MLRKTLTRLSLVGLVLTVALWGVSYFWIIRYDQDGQITLGNGFIQFSQRESAEMWELLRQQGKLPPLSEEQKAANKLRLEAMYPHWTVIGFRTFDFYRGLPRFSDLGGGFLKGWSVLIPLWIPALLFSAPFLLPLPRRWRRRKRKKLGLCLECGYDLRASKERCPECGNKFEASGFARR